MCPRLTVTSPMASGSSNFCTQKILSLYNICLFTVVFFFLMLMYKLQSTEDSSTWLALRTLRPQDTSAPRHFGTYIWCRSVPDTSAPVPKCLKTFREGAAGQQQANRTQTCPCGPMCSGPCPAASPHYANCAACVGQRHKQ